MLIEDIGAVVLPELLCDKLEVRLKSDDGVSSNPPAPIIVPALILKPDPDATDTICACRLGIINPKRHIMMYLFFIIYWFVEDNSFVLIYQPLLSEGLLQKTLSPSPPPFSCIRALKAYLSPAIKSMVPVCEPRLSIP